MRWSWTIRKRLISLFVLGHVGAVVAWNLPEECALAKETVPYAAWYILPTGQWQNWALYGPDPALKTTALEAVVRDSRGTLRTFAFPKMCDRSAWEGLWGYRDTKYAANAGLSGATMHREFAARFVVRKMGLKAEDFPAEVELFYRVWDSNRPGQAPPDPSGPPDRLATIQTYRFPTLEEAQP